MHHTARQRAHKQCRTHHTALLTAAPLQAEPCAVRLVQRTAHQHARKQQHDSHTDHTEHTDMLSRTPPSTGSYAQYASVPEDWLARVPATLPLEQAGGVPLVALTAWQVGQMWCACGTCVVCLL
jgi:hypothetical protein